LLFTGRPPDPLGFGFVTKLHQVLALEKTRKNAAKQAGDELYKLLQKHQLASGGHGTYAPATEDGLRLPDEVQLVQVRAEDVITAYLASQSAAWDIVATKDEANTDARADVTVDGAPLLRQVPVTTLIFLEKQLTDLRTVLSKAPTLDAGETWTLNEQTGLWETEPLRTDRTQKVVRHEVVVPPTDKHPAQVAQISEDVKAGTWTRRKVSGALPATRREQLLSRVSQLLEAVKTAREDANSADVSDVAIAEQVASWVLSG
jgi:hypothetical protein